MYGLSEKENNRGAEHNQEKGATPPHFLFRKVFKEYTKYDILKLRASAKLEIFQLNKLRWNLSQMVSEVNWVRFALSIISYLYNGNSGKGQINAL